MLVGLGLIFIVGIVCKLVLNKIKIPPLIGMIISGIILGPFCLNIIDEGLLNISKDLRDFALVVILLRAGLSLNIEDLKKVGLPSLLMSFVPATFEIVAMTFLSHFLLNLSILDSMILGCIVSAASPAVIVPGMLKVMKEGYGTDKAIPQLILSGASVDDVFVIVVFTSLIGISQGDSIGLQTLLNVPLSLILGILLGYIISKLITKIKKYINLDDILMTLLLLSISFIFLGIEELLKPSIGFSGLLAIMSLGLNYSKENNSVKTIESLTSLWIPSEMILFVLVGTMISVNNLFIKGIVPIIVLLLAMIFRMIGVMLSLKPTNFNRKEKMFCMISYTPKATVQAAIGGIPLSLGMEHGELILIVSVLAILISAPLGAIGIDLTYKKLLQKE